MSESLTLPDAAPARPLTLRRESRRTPAPASPVTTRSRATGLTGGLRGVFLGSADRPRWARPLLILLLLGTAALYLTT